MDSTIPVTIEVSESGGLCPACGGVIWGAEHPSGAPRCRGCTRAWGNTRSPAAAIQTLQALPPAQHRVVAGMIAPELVEALEAIEEDGTIEHNAAVYLRQRMASLAADEQLDCGVRNFATASLRHTEQIEAAPHNKDLCGNVDCLNPAPTDEICVRCEFSPLLQPDSEGK